MRPLLVIVLLLLSACEKPPPELDRRQGVDGYMLVYMRAMNERGDERPFGPAEAERGRERARQWLIERGYRLDSTRIVERDLIMPTNEPGWYAVPTAQYYSKR